MTTQDRIPEWGRAQIAAILEFANEKGIAIDTCLTHTGLTEEQFTSIDPVKAQEAKVIENLIQAIPTIHPFELGIEVGRRTNVSAFGVLGKALTASKTVIEVAQLAARYVGGDLHFNKIKLHKGPDAIRIQFEPVGTYPEPVAQFLVARDYGAAISFHEHFLRSIPELLLEVGFTHDWLPGMEIIEQHYDCEVKVNQPTNYMKGNSLKYYVTLPFGNNFLLNQFDRQLQKMIGNPGLSKMNKTSLLSKIENLMEHCAYQTISRDQMASKLNISARTLARYLQTEGTSWRQLTTKIRLNKAKELLQSSDMSIEQIAYHVGFSSSSAFSAAFSRENEMSPLSYREYRLTAAC